MRLERDLVLGQPPSQSGSSGNGPVSSSLRSPRVNDSQVFDLSWTQQQGETDVEPIPPVRHHMIEARRAAPDPVDLSPTGLIAWGRAPIFTVAAGRYSATFSGH